MSKFARYFFWLPTAFALLLSRPTQAQSKPAAELIITNAKMWTVDTSHPRAQAVAECSATALLRSVRMLTSTFGAAQHQSDRCRRKAYSSGFQRRSRAFLSGGEQLDNVQLKDVANQQEFVRRIVEQARNTPKGEWI